MKQQEIVKPRKTTHDKPKRGRPFTRPFEIKRKRKGRPPSIKENTKLDRIGSPDWIDVQ